MEAMEIDQHTSFTRSDQCQNNLSRFLNFNVLLNFSCLIITYFIKWDNRFGAISFQWDCIPTLHFIPLFKGFILLCSHPNYHRKVNCKTIYSEIIDITTRFFGVL